MASTEICLEKPFSDYWKKGYINFHAGENRRYVYLYNSDRERSSLSYSRYLMSVKLGRFLTSDEHVDHIDDDKTNDDLSNLQILTPAENRLKETIRYAEKERMVCYVLCANCNKLIEITRGNYLLKERNNKNIFCSRSCSSKYYPAIRRIINDKNKKENPIKKQHSKITEEIQLIKELRKQGLSYRKISNMTGFNKETVRKYW